jgi:hypothetical protein
MNKIILSLIALGALSGASFAQPGDLDNEGLAEKFAAGGATEMGASVTQPLAVGDESGMTAFEKAIASGKGEFSDR